MIGWPRGTKPELQLQRVYHPFRWQNENGDLKYLETSFKYLTTDLEM